jgi:16S rRNA (cytosine967-C5)-methyltransferase
VSPTSARHVALAAVLRVVEHGGYSNLVVPSGLASSRLEGADRRFAAELSYGTLRRLVTIDWMLSRIVDRPLRRTPPAALALLRLGAYQLAFTRVPAHAAVSETVALAGRRDRGFVNAVLRRLAADPPDPPRGRRDDDVAVRTGMSTWAVHELRGQLGDEEVEPAAAAFAERARLTLRTNTCATSVNELDERLASAGIATSRGRVASDSLLVDDAVVPAELPGFADGWFAIQDQASSFVVAALGVRPGERVLDACAAPGGKSGHLACAAAPGGTLVAGDVAPRRAALVREQLSRLGLAGHVVAQDARAPAVRGPFDAALVDAPCSGIGSARRRPELLWRVPRDRLSTLARLQVSIAAATVGLLRPGGRLVYSVCTFPRAETDAACDALLRHRPELEPQLIEGPDGPAERVRLWPHRHGTDGMFVAAFRKAGERDG